MDDPAAGGALGPELPDLIVLEVGVAELAQGWPLGAERARGAVPSCGVYRACRSSRCRAGSWNRSLLCDGRGRATVGPPSLGGARQGSGMCGNGSRGDRWGPLERVRADRRIGRMSTAAGGGWGPRHGPCAAAARARLGRGPSVLPPGRPRAWRPPAPQPAPGTTRSGVRGRGGGIARRGPAVGLAGARRPDGPVRPRDHPRDRPENDLKTTQKNDPLYRFVPRCTALYRQIGTHGLLSRWSQVRVLPGAPVS